MNDSDATNRSSADAPVDQLLLDLLESGEEDPQAALEVLCRAHPDQAETLRRRWELLADLGLLESRSRPEPARVPERLGEYRILRRLGQGGMGVVYLAHQASLDREVALKLVRPEQLYFDGARERFQREVTTIAQLSHPGIVPVYAVGEEDGLPYFAMEHVEGCTLADALLQLRGRDPSRLMGADLHAAICAASAQATEGGAHAAAPAPPPEDRLYEGSWSEACAKLLRRVSVATAYAHRSGVLHRDLKPSNVMVTPAGRVMLVDFGLSSEMGGERATRTGSQAGSLPYMAPEVLEGQRSPDRQADVYSLGVFFYELLTLQLPYRGATWSTLRAAILDGRPRAVRKLNPSASWEAETVCEAALEPDTARRYATVDDLVADLSNLIERRPLNTRRAGAVLRTRRWVQRHPAWTVGLALGTLLAVGTPTAIAWQQFRANERLSQAKDELEASNDSLDEKRRELTSANEQLESALERAEGNFTMAVDAVDRLLTRVGENLEDEPQLDEMRRGLFEDALAFYERFLAVRGDDPTLRIELARAHHRVGQLHEYLGDDERAQAALSRAAEALDALVEADAARFELRLEAASVRRDLAHLFSHDGDPDGAEALYHEALDLLRERPGAATWEDVRVEASYLGDLGDLLASELRDAEAEEAFLEALARLETIAESGVTRAEYRRTLCQTHMRLAHLYDEQGREEGSTHREFALDLARELYAEDPRETDYAWDYASMLTSLGMKQLRAERTEAARANLEIANTILDRLHVEHPGVLLYERELASAVGNLGLSFALEDDYAAAEPYYVTSLTHVRRVASRSKDDIEILDQLSFCLHNLAASRIELNRAAEAPALLTEAVAVTNGLRQNGPPQYRAGFDYRWIGHQYSLCIAHAQLGDEITAAESVDTLLAELPDSADAHQYAARAYIELWRNLAEERPEAAETYLNASFDLLHAAIELGFGDWRTLENDPEFGPVREHPEFRAVLSRLGR